MLRKIAYGLISSLILASFSVLPVSLALGQTVGVGSQTVSVTAVPHFVYIPVIVDVSASVDIVVISPGEEVTVFTGEIIGASVDDVMEITIPAGVTASTEEGDAIDKIIITPVETSAPPPPAEEIIGLTYTVEVITSGAVVSTGVTFDTPITLTMDYDEADLVEGVAETALVPAYWDVDSTQWISFVDFVIDTNLNVITITVDHLTEFAILSPAAPSAPSGGGGGGIRVTPPPPLVSAGGTFTQQAVLYSNDSVVQLRFLEGTLGLNATGEPLGEFSADEFGETYMVEMGDIYIVKMDDPPQPPEDAQMVGLVYDFGPDGATFNPPLTITLTYDESLIQEGVSEEHLIPAWWDVESEQWIPLDVFIVNSKLNIITAPVSHFTPFTVLAFQQPVEFATFAASNLLVVPTEVNTGEPVNVVISVTNTGGQAGSLTILLRVDGLVEETKEVTIAAGDSELISFNVVKNTAGTYSLEIAGFTGFFTVKGEPEPPTVTPPTPPPAVIPPQAPPVDWTIIGGIIAAIALAGAVLLYALRIMRQY
ncbi:hypothetical protein ACFLX7_05390, partial [Chloroflexota bacterium]